LVVTVVWLFAGSTGGLVTFVFFASPAFLFFFLNPLGTMRKEMLLWLLVAAILLASREKRRAVVSLWALAAGFPFLVLAHEAMTFYVGFLLVAMFLLVSEGSVSKRQAGWAAAVMVTASGVFASASWVFGGSPGIDTRMCANLVADGYTPRLCGGAIAFLDRDVSEAIIRVGDALTTGHYATTYLMVVLLAAVPFLFVSLSKPLKVGVALSLLATIPLFVVAIDWGRWIVISVWLITVLVLRFDGGRHITLRPITPTTLTTRVMSVVGTVACATLWSVPHCCEPRIGLGVVERVPQLFAIFGSG
jgi:hypothetical protein